MGQTVRCAHNCCVASTMLESVCEESAPNLCTPSCGFLDLDTERGIFCGLRESNN